MQKIKAHQKSHDGKLPGSLDDLQLTDQEIQYIDPSTKKRYDWVYYGEKSTIEAGGGLTVIILAPKPYKGNHIAGLSNGQIGLISESQVNKKLKLKEKKDKGEGEKT